MEFLSPLLPSSPENLRLLDLALHVAHSAMVLFMLTGWLWRKTLRLHLVLLILIWLSWLGLGYYVGHYGYCFLTDWHWQVKMAQGEYALPPSYIEYLIWQVRDGDIDDKLLSIIIGAVFLMITILSVWRNIRNRKDNPANPGLMTR